MKLYCINKVYLFVVIAFLISHITHPQDSDNKWVIGIGVNGVDIRDQNNVEEMFKDYLSINFNDVNMSDAFFRVSVSNYLKNGFSVQISTSLNKIKKGYNYKPQDQLQNLSFFAVDAKVKYDLNSIIDETGRFDPYILLGLGYSRIDVLSGFNLGAGYGFNVWLTNALGLNFQSDYNHFLQANPYDYFQHSFGLVFKLNGVRKFKWSGNNKNCYN